MVELLVGLPEVTVLGAFAEGVDVELHIETRRARVGCPSCGVAAQLKDWREVVPVDLQVFGKPTRLHWHKRRWRCVDVDRLNGSRTEEDHRIAVARMKLTDRAGRWVTEAVGR